MQSNFKMVFRVEVLHTYFEKNICNCLYFVPGAGTKSLIKRFGFVIRKQVNGFEFHVSTSSTLPALLSHIKTATNMVFFDFDIYSDDENFTYFTTLPIDFMGLQLYNSQSTKNVNTADDTQLSAEFSNNVAAPQLGSLAIYFEDIIKSLASKDVVRFTINYTARATRWQYFVVNKNAVQLNNAAVVGKTDMVFNRPEEVTLENGTPALLFSSGSNLIPLSKVPKYQFDLVNNGANTGSDTTKTTLLRRVIFKGLPTPTPQRISTTNTDTENVVSSLIYVYV